VSPSNCSDTKLINPTGDSPSATQKAGTKSTPVSIYELSPTQRLRAGKPGFHCVVVRPRLSGRHQSESSIRASDTHDDIIRRESLFRSTRHEHGVCLCELHVFESMSLPYPSLAQHHLILQRPHCRPTPSDYISWNDITKNHDTGSENKYVNRSALADETTPATQKGHRCI
jgi:hypothetical protein